MPMNRRRQIRFRPHLRVAGAARLSAWQNGADAAILDQHGTIRPYLGLDAVDQVRYEKGLSSWRPTRAEIGDTRFNSGTEAQIGLAGKQGLLVV
jgi:hypothetical protein